MPALLAPRFCSWALLLMAIATDARRKLVMYWGCDNPYNAGTKSFMDSPISKFCERGTYDIIQIAFLDSFIDPWHPDTGYPHLHLHKHHCNTTFPSTDPDPNVGLLHCPDVGQQIKYCQSKGVRVGLSLGGGTGSYYFTSDAQAKAFAQRLWDMFFVASLQSKTLRPFDDAVLDGVGLDIEGGSGIGYVAFLEAFSAISTDVASFSGAPSKPVYISAAPQCTAAAGGHIGFMWPIISGGAKYLTHMWPQFYNNYCYYPSRYNGGEWQSAIQSLNPSIKWYSGIPASSQAGGGFVGGAVDGLVRASAGFNNWDGIMMWDASWDEFSGWYSDSVRRALDGAAEPLLAARPSSSGSGRTCHAISLLATDAWCNENCNSSPPNCPTSLCQCGGPSPTPTPPGPPTPPTPPAPGTEVIGYYSPTWDSGSAGPTNANMGVDFSGWVTPSQAIGHAGPPLKGMKYVSVGGGNENGRFTSSKLQAVISGMGQFTNAGYQGICFDVEECDGGLASDFKSAFAAAKAKGLKVLVTTSHSAPYGCPDGAQLVSSWLTDSNIDYLSPQLYTSGGESQPDFTPNDQVAWSTWRSSQVTIVPSIVRASQYPAVQTWASQQGLPALGGFVQWEVVREGATVVV